MGNARHSRATICKGLVEAHGGRIWAASGGAGQGTQITFTLPATGAAGADAAPDRATRRPHAPPKEPVQMPILVVDDDPQTLRYVRDALRVRLLRTERPRLVLLVERAVRQRLGIGAHVCEEARQRARSGLPHGPTGRPVRRAGGIIHDNATRIGHAVTRYSHPPK